MRSRGRMGAWRYASVGLAGALACLALLAGSAGATTACPPPGATAPSDAYAPPADAVLACVGQTPVTGASFAHRFAIYQHASVPHRFTQATDLTTAMTDLIASDWLAGETRARHVSVSRASVRRALSQLAHRRFHRRGSLQRYLSAHGMSPADLTSQLRAQLLTAALKLRVEGHGSRSSKARAYRRFHDVFVRTWKARTACLLDYYVPDCSSSLSEAPASTPTPTPTPTPNPVSRVHPLVAVGTHPTGLVVDSAQHTLYVTTAGSALTTFDTQTCNATVTSGCGASLSAGLLGTDPVGVALDSSNGTIYTGNAVSDDVSVVGDAACNASTTAGCLTGQGNVSVDAGPELLAVDSATHTVYVPDALDDDVAIIDGRTCHAGDTSGCGATPAFVTVGFDPEILAFDAGTHTVYVGNSGETTLSLIDASACTAGSTAGCAVAQTVPIDPAPYGFADDPATGTLYVATSGTNRVSVIATATCNAANVNRCVVATVPVGRVPRGEAFDPGTRTLYVTNAGSNDVSVLDTRHCNAGDTSGCGTPATAPVGNSPRRVAIDLGTHAVYVSNANGNNMSIIDGTVCNGAETDGC